MVQILEEAPSFSTQLARSLGGGISEGLSQATELANKLAIQKAKSDRKDEKSLEKTKNMQTALGTINKMRGKIGSAGPMKSFEAMWGGNVTRDRAELAKLGTSLIPIVAAGVPIKNKTEFDKYSDVITNPNSRQAELEGALNAIEDIIGRSIGEEDIGAEENASYKIPGKKSEKALFDPKNPGHRSVRNKLMKQYNGDREMVSKKLSEKFREE